MSVEATRAAKVAYQKKQELSLPTTSTRAENTKAQAVDKFERSTERTQQIYDKIQARQARNKDKKKEVDTTPAPPPAEPPISVAPTPPTEPTKDARTYAEKYVAIYEQNSGHTLSAEERSAKISDVAQFYSEPSRVNRLESLVDGLSVAA